MTTSHTSEFALEQAREQAYVDRLYERLDTVRETTRAQLRDVLLAAGTETPQWRVEREAFAVAHTDRLAALDAAEGRLCFGAMDHEGGARTYIGRVGLSDDEQTPLLVDWRAPVATAFYQATLADPRGLVRRRHLRAKGREIVGLSDDVLVAGAPSVGGSDTALADALSAPRTGRMGDIVATLQAEQDRIIRAGSRQVLVVDGGPGTGKTAVALHRAAYLLYTERERLARSGVLVVGPTPVFLRYIEAVLPSLGETGVVFATPGRLFPGVAATGTEDPETAEIKGRAAFADVLAAAVRRRQRAPRGGVSIDHDGDVLHLRQTVIEAARTRARRSRRPHNGARRVFARELLVALRDQVVANLRGNLLDDSESDEIMAYLRADPEVRAALDALWPRLTAPDLLLELYTNPAALAEAAGNKISKADQARLRRPRGAAWTPADVPLLDEAAELLGDPDEEAALAAAARAERERRAERAYADEVLAGFGATEIMDEEAELAGLVEGAQLADRFAVARRRREVAEAAEGDRSWVYGHLIVDEAQEVSPMLWRLLWRRCPTRSATLVGDLAQASGPAAATTWERALGPAARDHWSVQRLTVNYRTPAEIMDVAADVLAAYLPAATAPRSARSGGRPPLALRVGGPDDGGAGEVGVGELARAVAEVAVREAAGVSDGRVAVIVPDPPAGPGAVPSPPAGPARGAATGWDAVTIPGLADDPTGPGQDPGLADAVRRCLRELAPELAPPGIDELDARVAVLTVGQAKGLEFDAVVVVEPAALIEGAGRGHADLYVALTRATRALTLVHSGALPEVLHRVTDRRSV